MHHSSSITLNMPWLDKPTQITESELDDLESNYEIMLDTIRNDTFGGIMPPQYDTSIESDNHTQNNYSNNSDNSDNDLLSEAKLFDMNNSEINESLERVRNELNNMSETEESVICSSPVFNLNDNSLISINLNDIKLDDCPEDDIKLESTSHNLSLPFTSPSSTIFNASRLDTSIAILPPMFNSHSMLGSQRRTQSEEAANSFMPHIHDSSTNTIDVVPQIPMAMSMSQSRSMSQSMSMSQIPMAMSMSFTSRIPQISNNVVLPDSFTSSMMFTPSHSSIMSHNINNNNNNAPQRPRNYANNRQNINNSDSIFIHSMANIIHGIGYRQHDIQSDNIDHSDNNNSNSSTQVNIERSNSLSLNAPRPRRRTQNRTNRRAM